MEADQKMVKLEQMGVVDGIITEDGDVVALGARLVLTKLVLKSNCSSTFVIFCKLYLRQIANLAIILRIMIWLRTK